MLYMWKNKLLCAKLSIQKINVSTTNQRYIKKRIRNKNLLKETRATKEIHEYFKNQFERRKLLFDKQIKYNINNVYKNNITKHCNYETIKFQ